MPQNTTKIAILGFGNVGKGTYDILTQNHDHISRKLLQDVVVKTILVRNPDKYKNVEFGDTIITTSIDDIISDPEITIVVEAMGGEYPAHDYICAALKAKKFVVTANKEVVSKHKTTFLNLARDNQVDIHFEAAVAGGIPLIQSLKVGYAGNTILSLYGILNGTTNYILTQIAEGHREFDDVLKEAQEKGFAEPDPTMDINGEDIAHKLVILAAVAFGLDIQIDDIYFDGIENITLTDILYAEELGYTIKMLAIGKTREAGMVFKVHPTLVQKDHPIANVRNEFNAVFIKGDSVGETMLYGKGAGALPTGSAMVADVMDIILNNLQNKRNNVSTHVEKTVVIPIENTVSNFYLRITANDTPGVLGKIGSIFEAQNISFSKVLQKEGQNGAAELVIITHEAKESDMATAIQNLKSQSGIIQNLDATIRVGVETDLRS